jgi:hypothetical protein
MNFWLVQGFVITAVLLAAVGWWSVRDRGPKKSCLGLAVSLFGLAVLVVTFARLR